MPYVADITEPLIAALTYSGGLRKHQLAGHAANLEFWIGEVKHTLDVIDGYDERFKRLRDGERALGPVVDIFRPSKQLRPSISDHELKALRRRVVEAAELFLRRCFSEDLISEADLESHCLRLDLDSRELRRGN